MVDVLKELYDIINSAWDENVCEKPLIIYGKDVRLIDVQRNDYLIILSADEDEEFFGIGGREIRRTVRWSLISRSSKSWERGREIIEYARSLLRDIRNWGSWQYIMVSSVEDLTESEKKIYSFAVSVGGYRIENI